MILREGRFVLFTALPSQLSSYWLYEYFPIAMQKSVCQLPSLKVITQALKHLGFELENSIPFFVTSELEDFFLYSGKHKPETYLSKKVRDGISIFSNLAQRDEVAVGLAKLARDIESGYIKEVMQSYPDTDGECLFIQSGKR